MDDKSTKTVIGRWLMILLGAVDNNGDDDDNVHGEEGKQTGKKLPKFVTMGQC